ncbi:hypothetical protein ACJA3S_01630 [Pseudomonas sp. KnCO4]|uniref:hypothetical protein n=1 Tax=Pseudomonas sp. KnCO4 TaxID=3381355 RepID=UPI003877D96A
MKTNPRVIDFSNLPEQEEKQEIKTEHGTFRWIPEYAGTISVKKDLPPPAEGTPPPIDIDGEHLYVVTTVQGNFVQLEPTKPASRISYDAYYPSNGLENTSAMVHLSDNSTVQVVTKDLHFDYTAPGELTIKSLDIFAYRDGTALDNFRLYD